MSARLEIDRTWNEAESKLLEAQLEVFLRNADEKNLVAPLRAAQARLASAHSSPDEAKSEGRAALALQQQWNSWLDERELLKNEIKRGKECLEQIQDELADMRARLEEWAAYERH